MFTFYGEEEEEEEEEEAYPDSRTSGGITPSERITIRDTTPPAAIVLIENTMPSS